RTGAEVVYACGPNLMLRIVAERCRDQGLPCQVAVEELMACGLGVCWTCVVPVIGLGGRGWWNVRACLEGPVFNGTRIGWDRRLGGIVTKSVTLAPTRGLPTPRMAETDSGMLNAIGLQNPGVQEFLAKDGPFIASAGVPIVVSVAGKSVEEFAQVTMRVRDLP